MVISCKLTLKPCASEACGDTGKFHPVLSERPLNIKSLEFLTLYELLRERSEHTGMNSGGAILTCVLADFPRCRACSDPRWRCVGS